MAGLTNLLENATEKATELPSWYTGAQQEAVTAGREGLAQAPAVSETAGQKAVDMFGSSNNPFAQGQTALDTIASGAANPWMQDASGQTVANPNTAMGGLFNAQLNYLNQVMPEIEAQSTGSAIGAGGFGGLRGLTAMQKARGDTINKMYADQYKAALQNQTAGVQAGAGLGNIGKQYADSALATGKFELGAPFEAATAYSNVLGGLRNLPSTERTQVQLSPISQFLGLRDALSKTGAQSALAASLGLEPNASFGSILGTLMGRGGGQRTPGGVPITAGASLIPNTAQPGEEGYGWQYLSNGVAISPDGVVYNRDGEVLNTPFSGFDYSAPDNYQGVDVNAPGDTPGFWEGESYD